MSEQAIYVFCLARGRRAPMLTGVPPGVPGAGSPRAIGMGDGLWAVAADVPVERYSAEALRHELQDVEAISRHAVAHAAVVEFVFRRAPVVPLKLFTLFTSDDRLRAHLRRSRARILKLFARVEGHEEWGVRFIAGQPEPGRARALKTGREYLQVKKSLREGPGAPAAAVRAGQETFRTLGRIASAVRPERVPRAGSGGYAAGASFLVKSGRRARWKRESSRLAKALAARGHRLDVSGPWPPYHFAGA